MYMSDTHAEFMFNRHTGFATRFQQYPCGNICTYMPTNESGKMTPLTNLFEDAHLFECCLRSVIAVSVLTTDYANLNGCCCCTHVRQKDMHVLLPAT